MPQPKKPAAKKKPAASQRPAAKKKPARSAPPKPRAARAAKAAPRVKPKPAERRSKRTAVARTKTEAARDVALFDNLAAVRGLLAEHLVFSAERLQEAIDDAVRRGRMLPTDAQEFAERLTSSGRRQLEELLSELDRRLGNGR
jgi:outer membrane biosynthesis protein TonB